MLTQKISGWFGFQKNHSNNVRVGQTPPFDQKLGARTQDLAAKFGGNMAPGMQRSYTKNLGIGAV